MAPRRPNYRSYLDVSPTAQSATATDGGAGSQQGQRVSAQLFWILLLFTAPFLCLPYLVFAMIYQLCLVDGKLTVTGKATTFIGCVFMGISWIPPVSVALYVVRPNVTINDAVNGITPIAAYYLFCIWGTIVIFRRFKLMDSFETETNRPHVLSLKDLLMDPEPIHIRRRQGGMVNSLMEGLGVSSSLGGNASNSGMSNRKRAAQYYNDIRYDPHADERVYVPSKRSDGNADEKLNPTSKSGSAFGNTISNLFFSSTRKYQQNENSVQATLLTTGGDADDDQNTGEQKETWNYLKNTEDNFEEDDEDDLALAGEATGGNEMDMDGEFGGPGRSYHNAAGLSATHIDTIYNGLELYIHLKGETPFVSLAAFGTLVLAAGTVGLVRTITVHDEQDILYVFSTIFFCGMFLVFYSTYAFIIVSYLHQVKFIQRLTTSIFGDQDMNEALEIAQINPYNMSHIRAWEAVRRLAVLEITNPYSVLNAVFTPSLFLSAVSSMLIVVYLVIRLFFMGGAVGQFILTLLVLLVLQSGFMVIIMYVAKLAQRHIKLHTSIIAQKTYEIARLIDERCSDIESGLLTDGAATGTAPDGTSGGSDGGSINHSRGQFLQEETSEWTGGGVGSGQPRRNIFETLFQSDDEGTSGTRESGSMSGSVPSAGMSSSHKGLIRNSSLANPELARQHLVMNPRYHRLQARVSGLGSPHAPAGTTTSTTTSGSGSNPHLSLQRITNTSSAPTSGGAREEDGEEDTSGENRSPTIQAVSEVHLSRPNFRTAPAYLSARGTKVAVGFGAGGLVDPRAAEAIEAFRATAGSNSAVPSNRTVLSNRGDSNSLRPAYVGNSSSLTRNSFGADDDMLGYTSGNSNGAFSARKGDRAQERQAGLALTMWVNRMSLKDMEACHAALASLSNYLISNQPRPLFLGIQLRNVRYMVVFVLLASGNMMFIALMVAFKQGQCSSDGRAA